jgi:hypothetical protein
MCGMASNISWAFFMFVIRSVSTRKVHQISGN